MCAVQLLRVSVHERILAAAEDFLLQLEKGEEAAEVPVLRALLTERLTAAAEQIVALLEETVAEYEDRVERSEREICRQRRLLDAVLKPKVRIHQAVSPADVQELLVSEEEVPPEQQEWSSRVEQEQPEPPHIKEEQEELWTSQEGEQLQGLEEADISKLPFPPVPVKSEDEEKPQSSQLHQSPAEESREVEPLSSSSTHHLKTGADGDHCGGPEPASNLDPDTLLHPDIDDETANTPEPETVDHDDDINPVTQSSFASNKNIPVLASDKGCNTGEKSVICCECGKTFTSKGSLNRHMKSHTGEKPFTCSECGKVFSFKGDLKKHVVRHMRHTGVKPFFCTVCGKSFSRKENMTTHMRTHTGEKPFSCNICDQRFTWQYQIKKHKCPGENSSST